MGGRNKEGMILFYYADDTLLFCEIEQNLIVCLSWLLISFATIF